jgi:hypothetical protein
MRLLLPASEHMHKPRKECHWACVEGATLGQRLKRHHFGEDRGGLFQRTKQQPYGPNTATK